MEIEIIDMQSAGEDGTAIIAKIRKPPRWLDSKDGREKEEIDVERKEITLLHLGKAELIQKEENE